MSKYITAKRSSAATASSVGVNSIFHGLKTNATTMATTTMAAGTTNRVTLRLGAVSTDGAAGLVAVADRGAAPAPTEVPDDLRGLIERAESALDQGDLGAARQLADTMLERFPHEVAVDVVLGRVNLVAGEAGSAEEYLRRALRVDPLFGAAHRLLGDALALQGRFREAVEWWQRWLKIAEQEGAAEAELQRVRDAVAAAHTLSAFLAGSRG